jgi:hypothetical protein
MYVCKLRGTLQQMRKLVSLMHDHTRLRTTKTHNTQFFTQIPGTDLQEALLSDYCRGIFTQLNSMKTVFHDSTGNVVSTMYAVALVTTL